MPHSTPIPEVPRLEQFSHFAWQSVLRDEQQGDMLTLSKIEGGLPSFPGHFLPPSYAVEFVVQGVISGTINHQPVQIRSGSCAIIMLNSILELIEATPDCGFYVLGFSRAFAEELDMHIPQSQMSKAFLCPVWQLQEHQMQLVLGYFPLLRALIAENNRRAVVNLVRSLLFYLAQTNDAEVSYVLSRSEEISGRFLSLVELHCREQHRVEWYASQLHLAPKYLSNVIRQTLHVSPNACIDRTLIRQAKSLLSSTSLSVQQIADRLGFLNQSHFGSFFKRQTGTSPSAFKATGILSPE